MRSSFVIKDYAVCYFDLMGQRDGLLRKVRAGTESHDVIQDVEKMSTAIRSFNNAIYNAKLAIEREPNKLLQLINTPEEMRAKLLLEIKKLNLGIQQFSDTTIFYASADSRIALGIFASWCLALSSNYLNLISNGILIRGGIAIGKGWEIVPNCLYGPVLEDVYQLEGLVADFPRIVMMPETYQKFKEVDDLDAEDLRRQGGGTVPLGFKCADQFAKDFDGVYILDYLSLSTLRGFEMWQIPKGQIYGMMENGFKFINTMREALIADSSAKVSTVNVARKISLLRAYWVQRIEELMSQENSSKDTGNIHDNNTTQIGE